MEMSYTYFPLLFINVRYHALSFLNKQQMKQRMKVMSRFVVEVRRDWRRRSRPKMESDEKKFTSSLNMWL